MSGSVNWPCLTLSPRPLLRARKSKWPKRTGWTLALLKLCSFCFMFLLEHVYVSRFWAWSLKIFFFNAVSLQHFWCPFIAQICQWLEFVQTGLARWDGTDLSCKFGSRNHVYASNESCDIFQTWYANIQTRAEKKKSLNSVSGNNTWFLLFQAAAWLILVTGVWSS